jgi:hypothetical protein
MKKRRRYKYISGGLARMPGKMPKSDWQPGSVYPRRQSGAAPIRKRKK